MIEQSEDRHEVALEDTEKLLTFSCGGQEYGLHVEHAREVVGLQEIDPIPMTPGFIEGVMNLRGKIVAVMNLRNKLAMPVVESTNETCIVVVDLDGEQTGIIVDFLVGVVPLESINLEESPDLGDQVQQNFVQGIAKLEKRVILILDAVKLLAFEEDEPEG